MLNLRRLRNKKIFVTTERSSVNQRESYLFWIKMIVVAPIDLVSNTGDGGVGSRLSGSGV